MIGDDELAALVRAVLFQLVRASTGEVVAELSDTIDMGGIPPLITPGIEMHHLDDPATWPGPGYLGWSAPNTRDGYPIIEMAGPPDAHDNRPALRLSSVGADSNNATIEAQSSSGAIAKSATVDVAVGTNATASMTALDDAAAHSFTTLEVTPAGLKLWNYVTSRSAWMLTGLAIDGYWTAAPLALSNLGTDLQCDVTFTDCVAGDLLVFDANMAVKCTTFAAGVTSILRVYVNGVFIGPEAYYMPPAVNGQVTVPLNIYYTVPADGSYACKLYGFKSAAGGVYSALYHTTLRAARYSRQ